MAEAYLNAVGGGNWRAYSAGSHPKEAPHPMALSTLRAHGVDPGAPRSKSWDEFARADAPVMDAIVTVCDAAAGETCPVWPRKDDADQLRLHWSFTDPAAATGSSEDIASSFNGVFGQIRERIDAFLARDE